MATAGSITLRTIVLDGSLLIFAVSRFMMFANPNIMLIKPMRTIALVGVLASAGARLTRVAPHEPSLEELYFAVRRGPAAPAPAPVREGAA